MVFLHCLWVGTLAGLVASRLIRGRARWATLTSSVAVGVLGALLGGLANSWIGAGASSLPHSDLAAAAIGAATALLAWSTAQRMLLHPPTGERSVERR